MEGGIEGSKEGHDKQAKYNQSFYAKASKFNDSLKSVLLQDKKMCWKWKK